MSMMRFWISCLCVMALWSLPVCADDFAPMFYQNPVRTVWTQQTGGRDGEPVLKVVFKEPVTQDFAQQAVYLVMKNHTETKIPFTIKEEPPSAVKVQNNNLSTNSSVDSIVMIDGKRARKMWLLEPDQPLAPDTVFNLKLHTDIPSATTEHITDMMLYEFHTDKASPSGGSLLKMFDPSTWGKSETD